jgi:hypothetical protein
VKPTDPVDWLADGLHRNRFPEHPVDCRCDWYRQDFLEASDVYPLITEAGRHLAADLSLPTSAPSRGPRTSDTAAESIDNLNDRQWAVWWVIGLHGDLTDAELIDHYEQVRADFNLPRQSASSMRTRRKELERAGHVVATGETRPHGYHKPGKVWANTADPQQASAAA